MKTAYPVYMEADVVVCGGGTAGAFAAIAAAEQGKKVLVIEQFGSLGGTATNGLVTPVMHTHMRTDPQCSYIQKKLVEKQLKYTGCNEKGNMFDPLVLRLALEELCVEAGVNLLYHTYIANVEVENGSVTAVKIVNKAGEQLVKGKMFIDATGDGDISVMAGAAYTKGNPETGINQPMSLRYILGGIDIPKAGAFLRGEAERTGLIGAYCKEEDPYNTLYAGGVASKPWALTEWFDAGIASGELEPMDKAYWQVFTIPGRRDGLAFNCPEFFENIDATNPDDLTISQLKGKKAIFRQLMYYRKHFPGFENAYVAEIAAMVGIRESREIVTEYVMEARDLFAQRKFEDMFCQSNYPIDVHGKAHNCSFDGIEKDEARPWYDIPYRSIVVKGVDNLFVTGRCLGAEFIVQSSLRVQHSVRSSGETAGIAAAMAIDAGIPAREVDGKKVRETMISLGAEYQDI